MSIKVMSWVWDNGPKDPTERLTLLALADWADDTGSCYPSMVGIAEKTGVTERGARGIVRRLEASGWITIKTGGGRGGKNVYRVLMDKPGTTNPEPETGNEPETRNVATLNPERDCTKPGTTVPPNRQEPSRNHHQPREAQRMDDVDDRRAAMLDRRAEVLRLIGLDGSGMTQDGRFTGGTNDQHETTKWDAMGLSRAEQDAKIRETLSSKRAKVPDFVPNTWAYFTTGMQALADAKAHRPVGSSRLGSAPTETPEQRRARRRKMIGG